MPPLRYALLGQGEAVSLYDLQVGPVLPQIADATGMPRTTLRIKTQVEPFHALCIHGQPAHQCLAYRDWAGASLQPMFVLFLDCRHLGVAVCARVVSRLQLTAADLLCLADAVVPDGLRVLVQGGTPVDGSPFHLQFYDGESVVVRTALPVQTDMTAPDDSGESDDANQVDSKDGSPDVSSPRSRSPRRDVGGGRASSSGVSSTQHMWNSGLCDVHALSPCRREDTSVQERKLIDTGQTGHPWTSHAPVFHGPAFGALAETPAEVADTTASVVGAAALRRVPTPCSNSVRWLDRGVHTGTGCKRAADCTAATVEHELTADALGCQPGPLLALQPDLHADSDMDLTHSTLLCCSPPLCRHAFLVKVCSFLEAQALRHAHVPSSTVADAVPFQLRLHDHLPARTFDLTALSVPVGKTLEDVMDLLRPWESSCWHTTPPEGLRLHPSTVSVLASCRGTLVDLSHADLVHVYTDGSFAGVSSAWSVVCVPHHAGRPLCPFWLHGMVQLDSQSRTLLGAGQHGAQEAEISAVCVALLWGLTLQGGVRFVLSSDSLVTIHRARGEWNYPSEEARFRESACQWDGTVIIEDVLGHGDWAGQMHWSLCGTADQALFVASCASLKGYVVAPQGLLRYGDFVVAQALATMQQDVLLLLVQLWRRAVPFAALVPRLDSAILSALCRLPGVRKTQGVQLALLFTCGVNEIPAALFHSFKLGA